MMVFWREGAFSHFTALPAALLCPGQSVSFDTLPLVEARLVKNDGHWQDVEPAVNLDYLQERLSAASATQGPESNAADLSAASSDGQARLVQLMTDIKQWQADGGSRAFTLSPDATGLKGASGFRPLRAAILT